MIGRLFCKTLLVLGWVFLGLLMLYAALLASALYGYYFLPLHEHPWYVLKQQKEAWQSLALLATSGLLTVTGIWFLRRRCRCG